MMGTLATVLAGKKIPTPEEKYWADVEGDIEDVNGILKITRIRVNYHLRLLQEKIGEAKEAFSLHLPFVPQLKASLAASISGMI